ncbi:MAG: dCMP deaminase family protein [Deltaproteobacteria bacterium]|nr:dCMP deaminase family protein [Deltaproteobacteria bacterium]
MGPSRPGWDEYFMRIARVVASRSDCIRRQVAALVVKDRRIIATGYNATPRGARNCSDGGCPRCASDAPSGTSLGDCLCLHAEENALLQAAYHGISVRGASLYCTSSPCLLCTKKIVNSGVVEVIFDARYTLDGRSMALLAECGVAVRRYRPDPGGGPGRGA